VLATLLVTTDL